MASPEASALEAAKAAAEYSQVVFLLSKMELSAESLEDWPWGLALLASMHEQDLESARFTWKRMPKAAQEEPQNKAIFRILQLFWNSEYTSIWTAISAQEWSTDLQPVIASLVDKTRQNMIGLVQGAYSTIAVGKLAALLGQSETEAAAAATAAGWTSAADGMITVKPVAVESDEMVGAEKLAEVSALVAHLSSEA